MSHDHQKSGVTIFLDIIRHLLVIAVTAIVVTVIWKHGWIWGMISVIPIYILALNIIGFAMLPLYAFTPENILKRKAYQAFQRGDFSAGDHLTEQFKSDFKVSSPEE